MGRHRHRRGTKALTTAPINNTTTNSSTTTRRRRGAGDPAIRSRRRRRHKQESNSDSNSENTQTETHSSVNSQPMEPPSTGGLGSGSSESAEYSESGSMLISLNQVGQIPPPPSRKQLPPVPPPPPPPPVTTDSPTIRRRDRGKALENKRQIASRLVTRRNMGLPDLLSIGMDELPSPWQATDWSAEVLLSGSPSQSLPTELDLRPILAASLLRTADPVTLIYSYRTGGWSDEMISLSHRGYCGRQVMHNLFTDDRIDNYAHIRTINGLKRALLQSGPCYISFPAYHDKLEEGFWNPTRQSAIGGRRASVIGYDDTEQHFIIGLNDPKNNAKSPNENEPQFLTYPYQEWGAHWEVWTALNKEPEKDQSTGWLSYLTWWR